MDVAISGVSDEVHDGVVVVIDVIRAFTTAAAAFDAGVHEILCVAEVDHALALKKSAPHALLIGEERGRPPAGFDLGNSPRQFDGLDLSGRIVIQRTSNGTRGLLSASGTLVLAAAATNASATARLAAEHAAVRLVCTGEGTSEDWACATYIRDLLTSSPTDAPLLAATVTRAAHEHRALATDPWISEELDAHDADVRVCADVDRYGFAIVGERTTQGVRLHRVDIE